MAGSLSDGHRLYQRMHPSSVKPADRELPTAETPLGRGRLLALAINSGTDQETRKAAKQALDDWQAEQDQSGNGGDAA